MRPGRTSKLRTSCRYDTSFVVKKRSPIPASKGRIIAGPPFDPESMRVASSAIFGPAKREAAK